MESQYIPGRTVEVPDIPFKDEVRLPARKTVLIIMDMQNDFVKPGGQLVVPAAMMTVSAIQALRQSAQTMGVRIAYTQGTHV